MYFSLFGTHFKGFCVSVFRIYMAIAEAAWSQHEEIQGSSISCGGRKLSDPIAAVCIFEHSFSVILTFVNSPLHCIFQQM